MRFALDIRRARDFGAGTYTRNLVTHLARMDKENHYLLAGTEEDAAAIGLVPDNFRYLILRSSDGLRGDLELSWALQREHIHLYHATFLAAPWILPHRYIMTVHDASSYALASGSNLVNAIRFYRTRHALHRAACVLTVSVASKNEVVSRFGLPPDRVEVIYNALDARLGSAPSREETKQILQRYSIEPPYLLYTGSARPQKNLPRLIEAFSLVKDELREDNRFRNLRLVIIGDEISRHPELRHAVVRSRCQNQVRFLGYLSPLHLRAFYAQAEAFVFPSLHEGFGLPPLEAMAHDVPVLSSNVSSLPEVLGSAALLVNPSRVFDIKRGILHLLMDDELRAALIDRGREQVKKFSWETSVQRLSEIYRLAAGGNRKNREREPERTVTS